jgi:CRISPR system Cascade subunit CasE
MIAGAEPDKELRMFLSLIKVNVDIEPGRLWLRNIYRVHQRLCMAFPSDAQKKCDPEFLKPFNPQGFQHVHGTRTDQQAFLFRIDPQPGCSPIIVVQSAMKPDWDYAFQNAGYLLAYEPVVTPFDPVFTLGQLLKFRLLANPTRRLSQKSTGSDGRPVLREWVGKRVPVPAVQLKPWLERHAEKGGFTIEKMQITRHGYQYFANNAAETGDQDPEQKARLLSVRFEGMLKVSNAKSFTDTIIKGIGPAKGFGFGLLSVANPPPEIFLNNGDNLLNSSNLEAAVDLLSPSFEGDYRGSL